MRFFPRKGLVRTRINRVFIPLAQAKGKKPKDQQTTCKMRREANATSQQPKAKESRSRNSQKPEAAEAKSQKPEGKGMKKTHVKMKKLKPMEK